MPYTTVKAPIRIASATDDVWSESDRMARNLSEMLSGVVDTRSQVILGVQVRRDLALSAR
jgi:hypothetical protein